MICQHCGEYLIEIESGDGVKFICEDDSWLLLRFSGTEPIVRFYAEAHSQEAANKLTEHGLEIFNSCKK